METPGMISMKPTVHVGLEEESLLLSVACTNLGDAPVRVPWGVITVDPFQFRLTDSQGRPIDTFFDSHCYSLGPVPRDSQVLLPSKTVVLTDDLMQTYKDIPQGNYTLDVHLDMGTHLKALRKGYPDAEHAGDFDARQEAPASFFVPRDFHSKWWDGVFADIERQKARRAFSIWKPWTWGNQR